MRLYSISGASIGIVASEPHLGPEPVLRGRVQLRALAVRDDERVPIRLKAVEIAHSTSWRVCGWRQVSTTTAYLMS